MRQQGTCSVIECERPLWARGKCAICYQKQRIQNYPEYAIWIGMKKRCYNKNDSNYKHYGGRGIVICERWQKFANFFTDMGPRPTPTHSIDRIDNNKGYSPDNCRWATRSEQANNKSVNRRLEIRGQIKTRAEWAALAGICHRTLITRLRKGWTPEKAVFDPVQINKRNRRARENKNTSAFE